MKLIKHENLRRRRLERIKNGTCDRLTCHNKVDPGFKRCLICRNKAKLYNYKRLEELKRETFKAYGGIRCACCGITELHMLCLDHQNGDGGDHRRELEKQGIGRGYFFYKYLRKLGFPDKDRYRVLCANCNLYVELQGKPCYHKRRKENVD